MEYPECHDVRSGGLHCLVNGRLRAVTTYDARSAGDLESHYLEVVWEGGSWSGYINGGGIAAESLVVMLPRLERRAGSRSYRVVPADLYVQLTLRAYPKKTVGVGYEVLSLVVVDVQVAV